MEQIASKNWRSILKQILTRILPLRVSHRAPPYPMPSGKQMPHQAMDYGQTCKESKSSSWLSRTSSSNFSPTFNKFIFLPAEIRLQIWELALFSTPRVVEFIEVLNITKLTTHKDSRSSHLLLSTPIPLGLQVCHETRALALSRYIFSTGNIKLYLDPEIDTLYFGKLTTYSTLQIFALCALEVDLRRLKRLAVHENFLGVLGRVVRNDSGATSSIGLAFKLLSGLSDLILVVRKEKSHGRSTLGHLCYDTNCSICRTMKGWEGFDGWIFPTYRQFVSTECNGVESDNAQDAYKMVLEAKPILRSGWLWDYVNKTMWGGCTVVVDATTGKIKACSVATLHRFIDVRAE